MGDSIKELPEDLQFYIVSFLPVKEAAKTSTVAKKWRNLWKLSMILQFDGSTMAAKSDDGDTVSLELREKEKFIARVNKVLKSHSRETIDEFSIAFDLYNPNHYHSHFRRDIDGWIQYALRKKVRKLELDLNPNLNSPFPSGSKPYPFPNVDRIGRCRSAPASLVALTLTRMSVSGEVVGFFVSNCPSLRVLHLTHVCGLGSVCAKSPAARLRSLVVSDCRNVTRFEICSPNLVSVEFSIWKSCSQTSLVLNGVACLVSLRFGGNDPSRPRAISKWLMGISGGLSRLKILVLKINSPPQHVEEVLQFPNLPRLQSLELHVGTGNLLCLIPLIDSAPLLHILRLVLYRIRPRRQVRLLRNQKKHPCLKVFEMMGFSGEAVGVEMVVYVLENADSLEKMTVNGKVVAGEEVDLMKAKIGSSTCAQDIASSLLKL